MPDLRRLRQTITPNKEDAGDGSTLSVVRQAKLIVP
jgi:hypothetical protein